MPLGKRLFRNKMKVRQIPRGLSEGVQSQACPEPEQEREGGLQAQESQLQTAPHGQALLRAAQRVWVLKGGGGSSRSDGDPAPSRDLSGGPQP